MPRSGLQSTNRLISNPKIPELENKVEKLNEIK